MFGSRYMPCVECGASIDLTTADDHRCQLERWADYQLFLLRDEIAAFERLLAAFLESPRGRFELWYAARQRRAR